MLVIPRCRTWKWASEWSGSNCQVIESAATPTTQKIAIRPAKRSDFFIILFKLCIFPYGVASYSWCALAEHRIRRLRRAELPRGTVALARFLIGKTLVHDLSAGRLSGRIVETEAYVVGDAAAHAYRGLTPRNRSLFLEHGHAYVYFIYGNWYSINVAGEAAGVGAGVLLRALEPLEGI